VIIVAYVLYTLLLVAVVTLMVCCVAVAVFPLPEDERHYESTEDTFFEDVSRYREGLGE
jgi:hypothetical protein